MCIRDREKEVAKSLPTVSGSLRESLLALERDHDYLLEGGVFTKDLVQSYSALKWEEVYALEHHPHPIEFSNSYNF
jgi:glutamine synthetase